MVSSPRKKKTANASTNSPTPVAPASGNADRIKEIWQRAQDDEWGNWGDAMHPDVLEVLKPAFRLMRTAVRSSVLSSDPDRADKVREILRRAADDIKNLNRA